MTTRLSPSPSEAGRQMALLSHDARRVRTAIANRLVVAWRDLHPELTGTDNEVLAHLADALERDASDPAGAA